MDNNEFLKKGYQLSLENANTHIRCAELISTQESYGIANSHLILAAEEAIKAYMIFTRAYDPEIEIKDYDAFFRDHKHKHQAIIEMSFTKNFFEQIMGVMTKPLFNLIENNDVDDYTVDDLLKMRDQGADDLIAWLKTFPKIDHNEQWWNEANNKKNNGFYVNAKQNKWLTPFNIKKKEYLNSHKIVKEIIDITNQLSLLETDPKAKTAYEMFKNRMKKDKQS